MNKTAKRVLTALTVPALFLSLGACSAMEEADAKSAEVHAARLAERAKQDQAADLLGALTEGTVVMKTGRVLTCVQVDGDFTCDWNLTAEEQAATAERAGNESTYGLNEYEITLASGKVVPCITSIGHNGGGSISYLDCEF